MKAFKQCTQYMYASGMPVSIKNLKYRTRGFIHNTLFSWISWKLLDSWKFNSWTATSQVKCIISYWNKEGSSWKFKRELSACNWFVKISHREKYPAYGIEDYLTCKASFVSSLCHEEDINYYIILLFSTFVLGFMGKYRLDTFACWILQFKRKSMS